MTDQVRVQAFPARRAGRGEVSGVRWVPGPGPGVAFAEAWRERLSLTPHANFTMSLDYLAHQAACGEPSRAVLIDSATRRCALVLHETGAEVVSGFPWRWQVVFEGADPQHPEGMTKDDAEWSFEHAQRLSGNKRLRFYSPHSLSPRKGYLAGQTVLIDLAHSSEEQLVSAMDSSRRRLARRSEKQGYEVIEAQTPKLRRDFETLLADTAERRHGLTPDKPLDHASLEAAASAWEMPWHWLLVGVKDGAVVAGLGLGRHPGGMVDGRASGSTPEAMKVGTNSHVWWESVRRSRLDGHSWMNLCGATVYKRQFGGVLVPIHCQLGGAPWWVVPNVLETLQREAITLAVRARRRLARPRPG